MIASSTPAHRAHRAARALGVIACVLVMGCTGTTYDETIVDSANVTVAPSTTLPTGTAAELLPLLVAESRSVGPLIGDRADTGAAIERIDALWAAVKQEIGRDAPQLLGTFESQILQLQRADRFDRAADADKAYRNLKALVDSYLG